MTSTSSFLAPSTKAQDMLAQLSIVCVSATFEDYDHASLTSGFFANYLFETLGLPFESFTDYIDGTPPSPTHYDSHEQAHTEALHQSRPFKAVVRSASFQRYQNNQSATDESILVAFEVDITPTLQGYICSGTTPTPDHTARTVERIARSLDHKFKQATERASKKIGETQPDKILYHTEHKVGY